MVHVLTLLFISSVFVFAFCKGDSEEIKKLNNDIMKVQNKIASVNEANEKLSEEIVKETKLYKSKIRIKNNLKNMGNEENKNQHKELEDLDRQLVKGYFEEDELKSAPMNIKRLKLGIQVTQENIKILEERRENGIAKSCLELEGMVANDTVDRRVSVLALSRIDDSIVLENKLRLVLTELEQANNKNTELKMQLKSLHAFYDLYNKKLNEAVKKIGEDNDKGQESIDKIKEALEEQKKRIADLEESSRTDKTQLDKWKKEGKKVWISSISPPLMSNVTRSFTTTWSTWSRPNLRKLEFEVNISKEQL